MFQSPTFQGQAGIAQEQRWVAQRVIPIPIFDIAKQQMECEQNALKPYWSKMLFLRWSHKPEIIEYLFNS